MAAKPPTISLCMIVKNESELLAGCLAAAAPFVDQIVVADTGSQDDTMAIAGLYADLVFSIPWQGDFAEARNASIKPASGDWVLVLDADERLEAQSARGLRDALAKTGANGFSLTMINHNAAGGHTRHQVARLFRNHLGLRFSGKIHEQLNWPQPPQPLPVVVHHLGYARPQSELAAKGRQRLSMLADWVAAEPENFNARVHLSRALLIHGGDLEQVVEQARAALGIAAGRPLDPEALPWAMYPLMRALFGLGRFAELEALSQNAVQNFPTWPDGWFALVLAQYNLGRFGPALAAAREFAGLQERWAADPAGYPHRQNATANEVEAALVYASLAAARLGREEEAAELAARLAARDKEGRVVAGLLEKLNKLGFSGAAAKILARA